MHSSDSKDSPGDSYTSLLADPVFEPVLDTVLDPVTEIDEPIVESIFEVLDPMPDSSVDSNLETLEDSTPEPLNDESSSDPSLEPVLESVADDIWGKNIFESDSSPIVEPVCESPVVKLDFSTNCDEVFTCSSTGSGFGASSGFSLKDMILWLKGCVTSLVLDAKNDFNIWYKHLNNITISNP